MATGALSALCLCMFTAHRPHGEQGRERVENGIEPRSKICPQGFNPIPAIAEWLQSTDQQPPGHLQVQSGLQTIEK